MHPTAIASKSWQLRGCGDVRHKQKEKKLGLQNTSLIKKENHLFSRQIKNENF
jgi:hypothetical protein